MFTDLEREENLMGKGTPGDNSAPQQLMCPIHDHPYWLRRNVRTGELTLVCEVCELGDAMEAGREREAEEHLRLKKSL